jgi:hypothetical protein
MIRDYVDVQVLAPGFHDPDQNRQEDAITPFGRAFTAKVNGPVVIHCAVTSGVALVIGESFASAPLGREAKFGRSHALRTTKLGLSTTAVSAGARGAVED